MLSTKRKVFLIGGAILIVLLFLLLPYYRFVTGTLHVSPLKTVLGWDSFKKTNGRVNIVLLGVPGEPHDGPYLSDTMLVANYDFAKNRIVTINLPRDIWSTTINGKLNSAYALGEAKTRGGGLILARAEISAVVGQPVPYGIVINFEGFRELIDFLGGVDVDVARSFVDKKYPVTGKEADECGGDPEFRCRYQTARFTKGQTHMDGTTALIFVRSRNAEGVEGSDFARGARQEKVLEAVKSKMVKLVFGFNVKKLEELYALWDRITVRNISNQQLAIIAWRAITSRHFASRTFALPNPLFVVPDYTIYGAYTLVPKVSWNTVHGYIACLMDTQNEQGCKRSFRVQMPTP